MAFSLSQAKFVHGASGRITCTLALALSLSACGYKGPLYMPPPAPEASLTTPPSNDAIPSVGESQNDPS